jgi:hypothetical protein
VRIAAVKLTDGEMNLCSIDEAWQILQVALVFAVNMVRKLMAKWTAASLRAAFHDKGNYALFNGYVAEDKMTSW